MHPIIHPSISAAQVRFHRIPHSSCRDGLAQSVKATKRKFKGPRPACRTARAQTLAWHVHRTIDRLIYLKLAVGATNIDLTDFSQT